jgi:uncharacterized Zn-finger protein
MSRLLARTRLSLAAQQLESGRQEQLVCLTCLRRFSNMQNLRRHLRLHMSRDSHLPDLDSDTEEAATAPSDRAGGPQRGFACDFCPERFANKAAHAVHEKSHADQTPECYVCNRKYADRYSLRYHLRTHGIGHQIRCELCNKSFPKPSRLQAHVNTFHKDIRNFSCSGCDKTFKTRLHLENHFLQHTGEKPFKCETCGESFRHKVSLVAHTRIHGDSKPYVCETCGKCFREPSTLKAHTRVHSGDKPYKCGQCDKAFTQRAGLNYHKSVHSGLKPFKCNRCDYATAKQASLRSHEKSIHGNKTTETSADKSTKVEGSDGVAVAAGTVLSRRGDGDTVAALPLPSPPLQAGDAVLATDTAVAQLPAQLYSLQSNSLPSFNILKSYESGGNGGEGVLMAGGGGALKSLSRVEEAERCSPYSQPSLSPPLTPPAHQEEFPAYTAYSGGRHHAHHPHHHQQQQHQFSFSAAPLNYSTTAYSREGCGDGEEGEGYVEAAAAGEFFPRKYAGSDTYASGYARDPKRTYVQYEGYYDYSYFPSGGGRTALQNNADFGYQ